LLRTRQTCEGKWDDVNHTDYRCASMTFHSGKYISSALAYASGPSRLYHGDWIKESIQSFRGYPNHCWENRWEPLMSRVVLLVVLCNISCDAVVGRVSAVRLLVAARPSRSWSSSVDAAVAERLAPSPPPAGGTDEDPVSVFSRSTPGDANDFLDHTRAFRPALVCRRGRAPASAGATLTRPRTVAASRTSLLTSYMASLDSLVPCVARVQCGSA
jgi:hypothetical protein